MARLASCSLLVVSFAIASRASAQDTALDESLAEARAALREGDAELAIDVLEEARAREDAPALQYELYLAHEMARDHVGAAAHLAQYLERDDVTLDPDERATLEGHLADLRALVSPRPERDPWSDPAVPVIGWSLLGLGIAGVIAFPVGASVALTIENGLSPECREDDALCPPGARNGIDEAWLVSGIGLGAGLVVGAVGAVLLFLAGEHQDGGSRSLPPDLDPSVQQRVFSLAPWIDPVRGRGGASLAVSF